ncbi:hypothetical protein pqer_cds_21 [Pandoravirus quercus]|uniref:Uncharacterized protein n=1 Tax=Pandoravirus quercus TaxID=2107709 RepID=A0A2U7U7P6_9VIRU|nr:hypothetical protein pqer_cds_21 [Pandoravirus quercus]AVK74443.1 hypothetical protein pqer_cds_21 [Pandoravirus quercus]
MEITAPLRRLFFLLSFCFFLIGPAAIRPPFFCWRDSTFACQLFVVVVVGSWPRPCDPLSDFFCPPPLADPLSKILIGPPSLSPKNGLALSKYKIDIKEKEKRRRLFGRALVGLLASRDVHARRQGDGARTTTRRPLTTTTTTTAIKERIKKGTRKTISPQKKDVLSCLDLSRFFDK